MDLATMRARLRKDLHDENSASYRWTDTVLDRHVARAVQELSLASPQEKTATLTATPGSRDLSVTSLSDRVSVEAVEYPTGKYPPFYVRFSLWKDTLTLLVEAAPSTAEQVKVYYGALHVLDASSSTLPTPWEDVVATGAGAYAALEWANYSVNRVNVGGDEVWRSYLAWGQERLAAFLTELARIGRRGAVRLRQMYAPVQPPVSQSTDWGP
ncbi:MAG: hypothetical protein HY685_03675 [Chloroflexi bacterium]|nr:hypothetical protein [Chloroflexota bacterium]